MPLKLFSNASVPHLLDVISGKIAAQPKEKKHTKDDNRERFLANCFRYVTALPNFV